MIKFAFYFALAGFSVPLIFTVAWLFLEKYSNLYGSVGGKLELFQLLLWPSSIFMLATAGHEKLDFKILAISTIANVFIYTVVGLLLWWGLNRQRWLLFILSAAILFSWYRLLNL